MPRCRRTILSETGDRPLLFRSQAHGLWGSMSDDEAAAAAAVKTTGRENDFAFEAKATKDNLLGQVLMRVRQSLKEEELREEEEKKAARAAAAAAVEEEAGQAAAAAEEEEEEKKKTEPPPPAPPPLSLHLQIKSKMSQAAALPRAALRYYFCLCLPSTVRLYLNSPTFCLWRL